LRELPKAGVGAWSQIQVAELPADDMVAQACVIHKI
jgi:hypothetical protein